MKLERYTKKRDFAKTPEPRGARAKASRDNIFVIQKHEASRLHYDLRLQIGDTLASWAAPKGPSLNPSHKRLAVHVEDHPLEYAEFEGVIPEGQYGGGVVMLWDRGTWTPLEKGDPAKALKRGKLSFTLHGERLHGDWTLTRMRGGPGDSGDGDNWLLIKHDDDAAETTSVTETYTRSVATDRTLDDIAHDDGAARNDQVNGKRAKTRKKKHKRQDTPDAGALPGARRAALPKELRPQLCILTEQAPEGDDWIHEIKFDGYRLIARRTPRSVSLITRSGKDWTHKFRPIAEAIKALPVKNAIIDGEAAVADAEGRTSFQGLQQALKSGRMSDLVFFVFDLLHLNGWDLTRTPLLERKRLLRELLPDDANSVLRYSDHVRGGGRAVQKHACELALEGIIAKHAAAPYTQGRSKTWLKIKCSRRQEFVIIGWSPPSGARKHFGALLLGAYDGDNRLIYTGRVGTGFNEQLLVDIGARLRRLERKTYPADEEPQRAERRNVRWVKPELVAEVEFTEWTDDGRLRHPSFQGLREDKEASTVTIESPRRVGQVQPEAERAARRNQPAASQKRRISSSKSAEATIAGVTLTNPDRVLYPEQGLTKLDLARYYEHVADLILPFIRNRPLSTVRCPSGRGGKCFFQKHVRDTLTDPIHSIRVPEKDGDADYICIDSLSGLIALVQFGVLELHPWGASSPDVEKPDLLTFDLDPGEGVDFEAVKDGALRVRDELDAYGLESYLKTSGGKGLHIVAPLTRRAAWDEAKSFCEAIARGIADAEPERYIATMSKHKRRGKIFVDYLRNGRGATSIAPYSTRARQGAPVSMPIAWDDLDDLQSAAQYTVENTPKWLKARGGDPWATFFRKRQQLTAARLEAAGVA